MVDAPHEMLVARAHLDGERALSRRGRPAVEVEQFRGRVQATDPLEAGGREDDRVERALRILVSDATEPGVDVAADVDEMQIGPAHRQLSATTRRSGAHRSAGWELLEGHAVTCAQRVAGIGARRDRGDHQSGFGSRRQILVGVDHRIHLAAPQRLAQSRGEDPGAAERCEGCGRGVALGDDRHQLGAEHVGDGARLGHGERTRPRADAQRHRDQLTTSATSATSMRRPVKKGTSSRTWRRASVLRR